MPRAATTCRDALGAPMRFKRFASVVDTLPPLRRLRGGARFPTAKRWGPRPQRDSPAVRPREAPRLGDLSRDLICRGWAI